MWTDRGIDPELVTRLALTEQQIKEIESSHDAFKREYGPLRDQLYRKRAELTKLWSEADPDEQLIMAKQTELLEIQKRIGETATRYQLACRKILSPKQRNILIQYKKEYEEWRGTKTRGYD